MEILTIYIVKNKKGKYYRSKGMSGYGESWVEDINKAKIYPKIGSAKRQVTYWSKNFPEYGIPTILELKTELSQEINQEDRVDKAIKDENRRKNIAKVNKLSQKFREAKERFDKAVEDLDNYHNEE